jgi:thiamine-phosphate diphosphorylase
VTFRFRSRLYAIVDPLGRTDVDPVELGDRMLAGGARLLQLRWKSAGSGALVRAARDLGRRARERGALFVVNDRADVALAADADGVHLGQDDLPAADARRLLGPDRVIGLSTHTVEQAIAADAAEVDYLGFGPIFATETKATGYDPRGLETLTSVRAAVRRPIVAIGGIRLESAPSVLRAGADAVAMISELARAADPTTAVRRAIEALDA